MRDRYVLSSAVITFPGEYRYYLIPVGSAKRWLSRGKFISSIGYDATADAMGILLGVRPPVQRQAIKMNVGDEALVFRLKLRVRDAAIKHNLTPDFVREHVEVGLLKRTR